MESNVNKFDLEERTLRFSKAVVIFCKTIPQNPISTPMISQVVRSSTSIGANYREANDALGKKDFVHRLRIARKEAKETIYWLELFTVIIQRQKEMAVLINECIELKNILSAIIKRVEEKENT